MHSAASAGPRQQPEAEQSPAAAINAPAPRSPARRPHAASLIQEKASGFGAGGDERDADAERSERRADRYNLALSVAVSNRRGMSKLAGGSQALPPATPVVRRYRRAALPT